MKIFPTKALILTLLITVIISCHKEELLPSERETCVAYGPSYRDSITTNDFIGNWMVDSVNYYYYLDSFFPPVTHAVYYGHDTTYLLNKSVVLDSGGTGYIDVNPINWEYDSLTSYLTISNLGSLFYLIDESSNTAYVLSRPTTNFSFGASGGVDTISYVNYKRSGVTVYLRRQ